MSTLNQKLERIVINLKVISKLEPEQRLLFKNKIVSIRNHYPLVTPIIRSVAGEDRNDAIAGLTELLEDSNRLIDDFLKSVELQTPHDSSYDKDTALPILMSLNRLKVELPHIYESDNKGLNAARKTYQTDPEISSKIEELIDNYKMLSRTTNIEILKMTKKFDLDSQINGTPSPQTDVSKAIAAIENKHTKQQHK